MTTILENAGVLSDGKLTEGAKQRYFAEIKKELTEGTGIGLGVECGPQLEPIPHAEVLQDLEDPTIYPELHATWLAHYESIAKSLDIEGNTPLLPICDPTALGTMIGAVIDPPPSFADIVGMLALGPGIMVQLKELFGPDIEVQMPDIIASLPVPPPVPIPSVPDPNLPDLGLNELFDFSLGLFQVPIKAFEATLGQIPSLAPNLTVPGLMELVCKGVFDSMPTMQSSSNVQQAASNVLGRETVKMTSLTLLGSTFGNGALVQGAATEMGYTAPAEPVTPPEAPAVEPTGLLDFQASGGKLRDTTREFQEKLVLVANNLGINPNFLAAVMTLETGGTYSSTIENPSSKAIGLIQFTGFAIAIMKTTRDKLLAKTNVEQLDDVEQFFKIVTNNGARKITTVGDAYLAVFASDSIGKSRTATIFASPDIRYTQNSGFDKNKDGIITVEEVVTTVEGLYEGAKSRGPI